MNSPKVLAISGHRELSPGDVGKVWAAMRVLVGNTTIDEIWIGGARGADNEALKAALHYRGDRTTPKLVVVVPNTVRHQPKECWEWIEKADRVVELGNAITPDDQFAAFHTRNRYLVDHAQVLVAFWNGKKKGGTASAVQYAKRCNRDVRHIQVGT